MACCGGKREQFLQRTDPAPSHVQVGPPSPTTRPVYAGPVEFQYTGRTGLSVLGPITRTRYRFNGPGARVAVDPRDAASLTAVPNVVRVNYKP